MSHLERGPHGWARVCAVHACKLARVVVQAAIVIHDVDDLQPTPLADLRVLI